jgi:Sulfotransferase domain
MFEFRRLRLAAGSAQRRVFGRYVAPARVGRTVATALGGRPADAFVCSFPKSGRTWMLFCLANYLHDLYGVGPPVDFETQYEYVPFADPPGDHVPGVEAFLGRADLPFILRSHAPYRSGIYHGSLVLILRDPRDVLVSLYHYVTAHKPVARPGFMDYLEGSTSLARRGLPSPPYALSRYLDSWVRPVLEGRVTVTRYELWREQPERGLAQLLPSLGIPVDNRKVAAACASSSVTAMRRLEEMSGMTTASADVNTRFVRRGAVGGWRSELNAGERARLCEVVDGWLTRRTKSMFATLGLPY